MLTHPEVATRSCEHCKIFDYDEKTGCIRTHPGTGELLKRSPGTPLPCDYPDGCPKGSPTAGIELSPNNRLIYDHYTQCRATGLFPPDSMVAQNAAVIYEIEQSVKDEKQSQLNRLLIATRG